MNPSIVEACGILAVLLGVAAAVAGTWLLGGLAWALVTAAALLLLVGGALIRTAALTPPKASGGES